VRSFLWFEFHQSRHDGTDARSGGFKLFERLNVQGAFAAGSAQREMVDLTGDKQSPLVPVAVVKDNEVRV